MSPELEQRQRDLSTAMLIGSFLLRKKGDCDLEAKSAYGAAILLPQLARTAGWPWYLTGEAVRSYIFLTLNIGLQFSLLRLIGKEESVMDLFSGQMYLCNFADGVRGPLGTQITPARSYPFDQWVTRVFVKDSLKAIFPHFAEKIDAVVDPGEYALESYGARWICCFVFMLATMSELFLIINMAWLIAAVPTQPEPWLVYKVSHDGASASWLDKVSIQIAGIPLLWKVVYVLVVWVPKVLIWKLTCQVGIDFLMETSCIEDLVVNSVAMAFILNIDEVICDTLMSDASEMLSKCESYPLYNVDEEASMQEDEILERFHRNQHIQHMRLADFISLVPFKLLACLSLTMLFVLDYYTRHCVLGNDGNLVSTPIFLPLNTQFSLLDVLLPNFFRVESEEEPVWHMPEP